MVSDMHLIDIDLIDEDLHHLFSSLLLLHVSS
jgi:hypothetical protein